MLVRRRIVTLLVLAVSIALVAAPALSLPGGALSGGRSPEGRIDPALAKRFARNPVQTFVVTFAGRADLSAASRIADFDRRGQYVMDALVATATASQAKARSLVARTPGATAEAYWIVDEMVVRGRIGLAKALAALPEVSRVRAPKVYKLVEPVASAPAAYPASGDPEWGVAKIGADQVWDEGIVGQGVVVANLDTGVDYTHPALVAQYRGNNGDGTFTHDYNWWDPTGVCGNTPCDNVAHGTHTMGTMVGGDGPGPFTPDIGVAPGARWIAAKGCDTDFCTEQDLISAGQFLLAPTDLSGHNSDPSKRPDLINNSWGSGDPNDTFYLGVVDAWRAAGIVPAFAIGNDGYGFCGSAGTPGNFANVIGVGATDINDQIADFSSLGPAPDGRIKPDVSAPGVNVTSSVPGGGYEAFDGTSMATPHTAGTIALMLSAKPALRGQYDAIATALEATAVDRVDDSCGGDPDGDPNNVYGDGRIDALAAVALVETGGTLAGTVTDAGTSDPIAGATVSVTGGGRTYVATTDVSGDYDLFLAAGSYTAKAGAFGYQDSAKVTVKIKKDQTTMRSFALTALPTFTVHGVVTASENGKPITQVKVVALGVPVPPTYTDGSGAYALTLPVGTYTLRAAAGGCTDTATAKVKVVDQDVVQDFSLFRKIDAFGHGCAPQVFAWVDAKHDTGLFGDDFSGRLEMPFSFPFYGQSYTQAFVSDNGYVNFLGQDLYNPFPIEIPSTYQPNAAIYALWQDLSVDAGGSIRYQTVGSAPNRAFVIEYSNVTESGAADPVSFEIKLWEKGAIDLLYGDNPVDSGDGANALVGIEDATGTDALQFSYYEPLLGPNESYRFDVVPTGTVHGVVTDANDGQPIAGATVTADPGGRAATTAEDGSYALKLRPGSYTLTASFDPYEDSAFNVKVTPNGDTAADFALAAPVGTLSPTQIDAQVGFTHTKTVKATLSNTGSAPLRWKAFERSACPAPPPIGAERARPAHRPGSWSRQRVHVPSHRPMMEPSTIPPALLCTIIKDPIGDGSPIDVTTVRAASTQDVESTIALDFAPGTPMDQVVGYVLLDTDQNAATGASPEDFSGLSTQDIGVEYFADLFGIHDPDPVVYIVDATTYELVAAVPVTIDGNTVTFDVPLDAVGDDGNIDTALVLGNFEQPTDWAPDVGHGTIEASSDLPWLKEKPRSGTVAPGTSQTVKVTFGSPNLAPGDYAGQLVMQANDPKHDLTAGVSLKVVAPDVFGTVAGTVSDLVSGDALGGATVSLDAQWNGVPYAGTTTTANDGSYVLWGPEGTWPIHFANDGYVTVDDQVTIVRGQTTTGVDAALDRDQPHATLDGGPLEFILTPGRQSSGTLTLGNVSGHRKLKFSTGEVNLGGPGDAAEPRQSARALPAGADPNAATTKGLWRRGSGGSDATQPQGAGDVLKSWATGMSNPWGVNFDGDVTLSDYNDLVDVTFDTDGNRLSQFGTTFGEWGADMAFDRGRNLIWQVAVGGDNGIYALDPSDGSVQQEITGSPWTDISQRGLAYDADTDTFYIGGWNEGTVYHVAGPSWPNPGETLDQCYPPDPNISGLAFNGSFGLLWEATNSDTDTIWLLDPTTCEGIRSFAHPDPGGNGAGLEMDTAGNLWTVSQGGAKAYLLDSELPSFSDVPWMSIAPTDGTVPAGDSTDITVSVDSTGLAPGAYHGLAVVLTNDPDHANFQVPVTLVVPSYQQGINAGGKDHTDSDGNAFAKDRSYGGGPFGYVGASSTVTTDHAIDGTSDPKLYRSQRLGMTSYRFDVEDGRYLVDLRFAELQAKGKGKRVFHVTIEGQPVLFNFDVFAEGGGKYVAVDRTFEADVSDGRLDIGFVAANGLPPIVNAILVTGIPQGGERVR